MPIQVLPIHLVNKIAAGEVIERPASVVKELVENSLDAGASALSIAIEDGGRKLIAVTDDGCGMVPDDLALAFAPHATSKIASDDDLFRISTMGFRGEALASIASISHAGIRTARRDSPSAGGHEIEASGQTVGQVRPCAAPPGTTVTVRDLFFNTPARRKFMKAPATELSHVQEQFARLALPQPRVAFVLTHNGRTLANLPPATSTLARVSDLFGPELAEGLVSIAPRRGAVQVAGLAGTPAAARASGKWQYFFLNGRYIRDRLLSHALREAYRGLLDPTRWPVAFVFITLDPAEVDINVHPTKVEVRFRDGNMVHSELLAALRDTLNRANLAPSLSIAPGQGMSAQPLDGGAELPTQTADSPAALDAGSRGNTGIAPDVAQVPCGQAARAALDNSTMPDDQRRQSLRQAMADFFRSAPSPQPRLNLSPEPYGPRTPAPQHGHRPPAGGPPADGALVEAVPLSAAPAPAHEPPAAPLAEDQAVQVHNTYIVAACDKGLLIIDQHALHERLLYNDIRRRLSAGGLEGQRLLIPVTIAASPVEVQLAADHADLLARLGLEIAPFGPRTLAVHQFPSLLGGRGVDAASFVRDVLDTLREDEHAARDRLIDRLLETMACKAAVKAGDPLAQHEIAELLRRRIEADDASSCPHGRPTTIVLTLKELQKHFLR